MNYKVLYRKYRPNSFDTLVGQNHIVSILKNSIKENKIAHAYMFSGPRGTGKTSTARILAKTINCLNNGEGVACDKCDSCLTFNSNPDIIEIDAASNNGVDEIRELINNVKIMPTSLKYKVYIIDEVHMLSQSAFNALLLTLEEPPEHVVFILATTNIESVPITILSRCQRFDFKRINDESIIERLKFVCQNENIAFEEEGLKEIANLSDGGMRDALSILDQLSKNNEKITIDVVAKEIGSISNKKIENIIKQLDEGNVKSLNESFIELQNTNLNYKVIIKKFIYTLSDISVSILNGDSSWNISFDEIKKLIFELNDLLNKININVEPYLLIKMTFLSYVKNKNNKTNMSENTVVTEKNKDEKKVSNLNEPEKTNIKEKNTKEIKKDNNLDDFINIRINNCFVKAAKEQLIEMKAMWNNFVTETDNAVIKGLIADSYVVTSSDEYGIIVTTIAHKDMEFNDKVVEIEKLFKDFSGKEYKLVALNESRWNLEKEKYINNLKNKYVYNYMEEAVKEDKKEDISSYADIFDLSKVEVE